MIFVLNYTTTAVIFNLDHCDNNCPNYASFFDHIAIFKNSCARVLKFGASVRIENRYQKAPCEYSNLELDPFNFDIRFNYPAGICDSHLAAFSFSLSTVVVLEFFAMYCLVYNYEKSRQPAAWFTFLVFGITLCGLFLQALFFDSSKALSPLGPIVVLLIILMSTAGSRKELKSIFCGFPSSSNVETMIYLTHRVDHPTPDPIEDSELGASYRTIKGKKSTLPDYYDVR